MNSMQEMLGLVKQLQGIKRGQTADRLFASGAGPEEFLRHGLLQEARGVANLQNMLSQPQNRKGAPSGFEFTEGGGELAPIPGGPQDPSVIEQQAYQRRLGAQQAAQDLPTPTTIDKYKMAIVDALKNNDQEGATLMWNALQKSAGTNLPDSVRANMLLSREARGRFLETLDQYSHVLEGDFEIGQINKLYAMGAGIAEQLKDIPGVGPIGQQFRNAMDILAGNPQLLNHPDRRRDFNEAAINVIAMQYADVMSQNNRFSFPLLYDKARQIIGVDHVLASPDQTAANLRAIQGRFAADMARADSLLMGGSIPASFYEQAGYTAEIRAPNIDGSGRISTYRLNPRTGIYDLVEEPD